MKILICVLTIVPGLLFAKPVCEEGNAIPESHKQVIKLFKLDWMKNAVYCDFGIYQVLAPSDKNIDTILVLKNEKAFMMYKEGFGVNLFQSYPGKESVPYLSVQNWDKNGIFERLDYSIVDKNGKVTGSAQDKTMSGRIEVIQHK